MNERFTRSESLFLAAYSLWLVFAAIRLTYLKDLFAFSDLQKIAVDLAVVLLLIKLYTDDLLKEASLAGIAVIGLFYIIFRHTGAEQPMYMILFLFSARNVDLKKVFRVTIVIQLAVMIATVSTALLGIIPNEIWTEHRERLAYGYTYCTYGSHIAMFLSLLYMSLKRTLKLHQAAILFGFNFLWYLGTDTNTDLYLFVFSIAGCYLISVLRFGFDSRKIAKICYMAVGPVIVAIALTAQFLYDGSQRFWVKASEFVNGRIRLGHEGIDLFGITVWGQKIKWVGAGGARKHPDWVYNYVDCSYLKYLLHYGIVFEILLLLGIILAGKYVAESRNPGLQVAFIAWLIFGAIDAEFFSLDFQPVMLLMGCAFMSKTEYSPARMPEFLRLSRAGG